MFLTRIPQISQSFLFPGDLESPSPFKNSKNCNPVDLVQINFENGDEKRRKMNFGLTWEMGENGPENGKNGFVPGPRVYKAKRHSQGIVLLIFFLLARKEF